MKKGKQHVYQIKINGKLAINKVNSDARVFKNVRLWRSDPWYPAAKACVKNFFFANILKGKEQGKQQF